jgi:hypothetical protein
MTPGPPLPRSTSGFRTARELYEAELSAGVHLAPAVDPNRPAPSSSSFLVLPECGLAEARRLWNLYLEFRDLILSDPACYDEIAGRKEMNRTGATRLAVPFGLSIEERAVEEGRVHLPDSGDWDYRFRVRVRVGKGQRFVDGIGSCRLTEVAERTRAGEIVPLSLREHFALTRAWTRAVKRAIADIVGGTEAEA